MAIQIYIFNNISLRFFFWDNYKFCEALSSCYTFKHKQLVFYICQVYYSSRWRIILIQWIELFRRGTRAYTEIDLGEGGGGQIWTENSKHLASWISGISSLSIKSFKGTTYSPITLHVILYFISILQTKLAGKSIVSKKSTFYYTVMLVIICI